MSINRTPKDWTVGEGVTAAEMDAEVRDLWTGLQASAVAYTTSPSNLTTGNGTLTSRWHRVGKWITVEVSVLLGSTSAITGNPTFSLPTPALFVATQRPLDGRAWLYDDSTASSYYYVPCLTSGGGLQVRSTAAPSTAISGTVPFTWATSDRLYITVSYEAA